MHSIPLFHLTRPDGSITGPHHAGFLRQGLESGELKPDSKARLDGTQDWLPLSEFVPDLEMLKRQHVLAFTNVDGKASEWKYPGRKFWALILFFVALSLAVWDIFLWRWEVTDFGMFVGFLTLLTLLIGIFLFDPPTGKDGSTAGPFDLADGK